MGTTGDIEGRAFVGGNMTLGGGFAIGNLIHTGAPNATDIQTQYALAVGGSLTWGNGALYPDGTGNPYPGAEEGMYVGGSVTAPSYLASRQTGGNCYGCLDNTTATAFAYYIALSEDWSSQIPNAFVTLSNNGLFVSTNDPDATRYYIQIDSQTFNKGTYWSNGNNVNTGAEFIITITGTDNVVFAGGSFQGIEENIAFNIPGSRVIVVQSETGGSILAPEAVLSQSGGVEDGFTIVGSVAEFVECRKPKCPIEYCCKYCPFDSDYL